MKFRKKPVVIDAIQFDGSQEGNRQIIEWTKGSKTPALMDTAVGSCSGQHPEGFDYPVLRLPDGERHASPSRAAAEP